MWSSPLDGARRVAAAISFALIVARGMRAHPRLQRARGVHVHARRHDGHDDGRERLASHHSRPRLRCWPPPAPARRSTRRPGARPRLRSIHNHYLTLPVLFTMLSNHFPATYGQPAQLARARAARDARRGGQVRDELPRPRAHPLDRARRVARRWRARSRSRCAASARPRRRRSVRTAAPGAVRRPRARSSSAAASPATPRSRRTRRSRSRRSA